MQVKVESNSSEVGKCGCGRSPTGFCIGWHALSEDAFTKALNEFNAQRSLTESKGK